MRMAQQKCEECGSTGAAHSPSCSRLRALPMEEVRLHLEHLLGERDEEIQRLKLQIETLTKERDQWKNSACGKYGKCGLHCNCYNDIDWDRPGCQWCEILRENTSTLEKNVKLEEDLATANRLNGEYKEALESIVRLSKTPSTREIALRALEQAEVRPKPEISVTHCNHVTTVDTEDGLKCMGCKQTLKRIYEPPKCCCDKVPTMGGYCQVHPNLKAKHEHCRQGPECSAYDCSCNCRGCVGSRG